jgi:putative hydrolase of the HAD superfamily
MITTVAFDLDDTLYDEVEYCRSGFAAVGRFLANSPDMPRLKDKAGQIFDTLWRQFTAGNHTKTFNAGLDQLGIGYDEKLIAKLVEVYRNHSPKITLPEDSGDALNRLSGRYTLALLTDGFLPAQQLKVQALGIEKYFKCIIYTEQLGRGFWKPSPVSFEKLMGTLNTKPENMAYVADNAVKDFIAPNKLGFSTIQIVRLAGIHTEPAPNADAEAKYVIRRVTELPPLLEQL